MTDIYFFYLCFLSRTFTIHRTVGEGGGYFFKSSLPLSTRFTLRHQPGDYYRELTSAHSWQPDSNREPLVFERKSLTIRVAKNCAFRWQGCGAKCDCRKAPAIKPESDQNDYQKSFPDAFKLYCIYDTAVIFAYWSCLRSIYYVGVLEKRLS